MVTDGGVERQCRARVDCGQAQKTVCVTLHIDIIHTHHDSIITRPTSFKPDMKSINEFVSYNYTRYHDVFRGLLFLS